MPEYRIYHLDGAGKVDTTEWLDAAGDEAAVRLAQNQAASAQTEVWQGRRLVSRIAHESAIAPPTGPARDNRTSQTR